MKELPKHIANNESLPVRRGRVDSVDLYEVKDNELDILEKGEPTGIHLNFSIFLLSLAFSAILNLSTTATFKNDLIEILFIVISVVGILGGGLLLILWWHGRKSIKSVIKKIRDRISADTENIKDMPSLDKDDSLDPLNIPSKK